MTKDYLRAASPVQAGIDPLVAEKQTEIKRLSDGWAKCFTLAIVHQEARETAEAQVRSQAERIAELEDDIRIGCGNIDAAIDDYNTERNLREAAESLFAEAREALEEMTDEWEAVSKVLSSQAIMLGLGNIEASPFVASVAAEVAKARATLSRLKPGEKGGE